MFYPASLHFYLFIFLFYLLSATHHQQYPHNFPVFEPPISSLLQRGVDVSKSAQQITPTHSTSHLILDFPDLQRSFVLGLTKIYRAVDTIRPFWICSRRSRAVWCVYAGSNRRRINFCMDVKVPFRLGPMLVCNADLHRSSSLLSFASSFISFLFPFRPIPFR